jgi:hypothetical protein
MRYMTIGSIAVLAAALVLFVSSGSFAETRVNLAANGTISGKVTDADGNGVAGATVRVMAKMAAHEGGKKKLEEPAKPPRGDKPAAVAEATTGADGTYRVDVPPGEYTVMAMAKEKGRGRAQATVTEGKTTENVDIKLEAAPAGKGGEGGKKEKGAAK